MATYHRQRAFGGPRKGHPRVLLAILCAGALSSACGLSGAAPHRLPKPEMTLSAVLKRLPAPAKATLQPGAPLGLSTVQFVDGQDGWAGGNGVILATSDGGATWHTQFVGGGNVTGFSMLSATAGYAATSSGLLATQDGKTWRRVSPQPLAAVHFFSAQQGYGLAAAAGGGPPSFHILETEDGGASWQTVPGGPIEDACFFSPQEGVAVALPSSGVGVSIRTTSNGGTSWSSGPTLQAAGYAQQLVCTPDGSAWMVLTGEGEMTQQSYSVFRSANAGLAWAPVLAHPLGGGLPAPGNPTGAALGPGTSPGPLTAIDKNHAMMLGVCYACGGIDGTLTLDSTSDGGTTWQLGKAPIAGAVPSSPMFFDMLSPLRAWLLTSPPTAGVPGPGARALIQSTTDGGAAWHDAVVPAPLAPIGNVQFETAAVGYGIAAAGNPRAVLKTVDGGAIWRTAGTLPPSVAGGYTALAVPQQGVLFVGTNQSLIVSHNGGASFSRLAQPRAGYGFGLSGIAFSGPKTGCTAAASAKGWLDYATRDGGKTWRKAGMQGVAAALCAEDLVNPPLAQLAAHLVARLSPLRRGKGFPNGPFVSASAAVGGGSLWLAFTGSPTAAGRIYVLGPGPQQLRVYALPGVEEILGGLSPLGPNAAYLWTEDGRIFSTVDRGAAWQQVAPR